MNLRNLSACLLLLGACTPDTIIVNFDGSLVEVVDSPSEIVTREEVVVDTPPPDALPDTTPDLSMDDSPGDSWDTPDALEETPDELSPVVDSPPVEIQEPSFESAVEHSPEPSPDASGDITPEMGVDVMVDREVSAPPDADPCHGLTLCGSRCVDTRSDPSHCGGCGVICNLPGAENECSMGSCAIRLCHGTLQDCDSDSLTGCEIDTSTSPSHCGRCGFVCPRGSTCSAGVCSCPSGTTVCAGVCTPHLTDPAHCGGCSPCPTTPNASTSCILGVCEFSCNPGYIRDGNSCVPCGTIGLRACSGGTCSGDLVSCGGVCRRLTDDVSHCGACGRACRTGFPCVSGECMVPTSCMASSSCGITTVRGGMLEMGDVLGVNSTPIQRRVTISPLYVDTYEVTVERFRSYWNAGHPSPSSVLYPSGSYPTAGSVTEPGSGVGCTWRGPSLTSPINCVNWTTAQAFCVWDGGRLPTEAEWEWVARGGNSNPYPWGSTNPEDGLVCWSGNSTRTGACVVGGFPDGTTPDGVHDMGGGVYEWMADSFQNYSYAGCWSASEHVNPLCGQLSGMTSSRVVRGGSWETTVPTNLRVASRISRPLTTMERGTGFRCVRSR